VTINVQQATADINALLGIRPDPGIPDGWRVPEVLDQSRTFIDVPLIIDRTVNEFRSLGGTPSLFGERPLLTAVNGIGWLRGMGELDVNGHPVNEVVGYIDRIRDMRFGLDRLFDPRFGDFMVDTLTGFSVRELDTGNDQIIIESVVRDRVIYMEIRDIGDGNDPRVVEYQLRMRDGQPLPDWIRMDARGLAIIERPVDAQEIRLILRAIRADGSVIEIPVVIQGATGEIQLDRQSGDKVGAAAPLSKMMALAANRAVDDAARLTRAFG
jgi:large repetitive protein